MINRFFPYICLFSLIINASHFIPASKANESTEYSKLQGTWKAIEYENASGKHTIERNFFLVFVGKALYTRSETQKLLIENLHSIQIYSSESPKLIELTENNPSIPKELLSRTYMIYRFDGDKLIIATSRSAGKKPDSFTPAAYNDETRVVDFVTTYERQKTNMEIPDHILKRLLPSPDPTTTRSNHPEAETVLLKFLTELGSKPSIETLEPLVAESKAQTLVDLFKDQPSFPATEIKAGLSKLSIRDAKPGERVLRMNGDHHVVTKDDCGPNKLLLILYGPLDNEVFWLFYKDKQWKVDAGDIIARKQSKNLDMHPGIFLTMSRERVNEIIKAQKPDLEALFPFSIVKDTDSELIFDLKSTRIHMTFTNGKLSGYKKEMLKP